MAPPYPVQNKNANLDLLSSQSYLGLFQIWNSTRPSFRQVTEQGAEIILTLYLRFAVLKQLLPVADIAPLLKLKADLLKVAAFLKAKFFMQRYAFFIR